MLICAPSNAAIDEILSRLLHQGVYTADGKQSTTALKIVRLAADSISASKGSTPKKETDGADGNVFNAQRDVLNSYLNRSTYAASSEIVNLTLDGQVEAQLSKDPRRDQLAMTNVQIDKLETEIKQVYSQLEKRKKAGDNPTG